MTNPTDDELAQAVYAAAASLNRALRDAARLHLHLDIEEIAFERIGYGTVVEKRVSVSVAKPIDVTIE